MYAKRVQIVNYGPISQLNIEFPFDGDIPKPVVLVGENGSGKSILLSHIVNGLISGKDLVFPGTPEVETGMVFKIRSPLYIRSGSECYFGRVDFEDGMFTAEVMARRTKHDYENMPSELTGVDANTAWGQMDSNSDDILDSSFTPMNEHAVKDKFSKNCALYFPSNRFEEPAWLNEDNLKARARFMYRRNFEGHTNRKLIAYSPLQDNQDWIFEVIYDRATLEVKAKAFKIPLPDGPPLLHALIEYSGISTRVYEIALAVIRCVMKNDRSARFGIGRRGRRLVSLMSEAGQIVPNIFQLSSGETSLLNMFLSIVRDFDLSGSQFSKPEDVRGIVVVDEVDLHLHAAHQYEILPQLIKMFPRVQFIVTSHAPLFVLGMEKAFGEDGFGLYRMPQGDQISPEEFSEFAGAYQAFTATSKYSDDVRSAIENSRKPVVFMEGTTDTKYLQVAAELLQQKPMLESFKLRDGGGDELRKTWSAVKSVPEALVPGTIVVVRDCDYEKPCETKGNKHLLKIPQQAVHPIQKGIENLFGRETLERARSEKPAFINVISEHVETTRGQCEIIPEKWTVDENEKSNLCDWICENGSAEDFAHFRVIFDLLAEALEFDKECSPD